MTDEKHNNWDTQLLTKQLVTLTFLKGPQKIQAEKSTIKSKRTDAAQQTPGKLIIMFHMAIVGS